MKRVIVGITAFVLLMSAQGTATAGLTATIVNPSDSSSLMTLSGSGSFNVAVRLNATGGTTLTALQMRLQEVAGGNSPSGAFTLNSVIFASPTWSADAGMQVDPAPQALSPSNSYTTDAIGDLPDAGETGTGVFNFATLNITLSNSAPANYYLNLVDIVYGDSDFNDQVGAAGSDFHVQVVPAPGAVVLGMIGLSMVGWARRRVGRRSGAERQEGSSGCDKEMGRAKGAAAI